MSDADVEREYRGIVRKLPTNSPIFLPTDRMSPAARLRGVQRVKAIYDERFASLYQPQLRALREEFKDRDRCFVIGNGPSLNRTDLEVLKDEVTFAVNGFFLKARDLQWTPTFYVVEDHLVAEDRREWINAFKGPRKLFPIYLAYCLEEGDDTLFFNHRPRISYPHGFDFSTDAAEITYTGCTVTFTCLQLAFYLGFKEIYLIGVDADYELPKDVEQSKDYGVGVLDMKSDDKNHFHPDYFGKGFRWHDPQVNKMVEAYQQARRVVDANGAAIHNATVGGRLEVFDRRAFGDLFPNARTPDELDAEGPRETAASTGDGEELQRLIESAPRLLLIDFTRAGDGTATGEVKSALFEQWPKDRLLQVYWQGNALKLDGATDKLAGSSRADLSAAIDAFDPQLVLYRPVPNRLEFHQFAMGALRRLSCPSVVWIMDDWLKQLEVDDPAQYSIMDGDWRELLASAACRLSIGSAMSAAFSERYGYEFLPFANAIKPEQWSRPSPRPPHAFSLRYAGSLAENMGLASIERIAEAVEQLAAQGADLVFEINTRPVWLRRASALFDGRSHVVITTNEMAPEEYRAWLAAADVVVIAYNFDSSSVRYIQYSIANKLPECLASGAVVLGHGPREVATIDLLTAADCAITVTDPDVSAICRAISKLMASPFERFELALKAQVYAFNHHNLTDKQSAFMTQLSKAAQAPATLPGYSRAQEAHVDETGVVAFLQKKKTGAEWVMVDVGAHFGTSAKYFHHLGWRIYCFEPDASNREQLEARFKGQALVRIDPRGLSDSEQLGIPFFSSEESTGVSGLNPFLSSHRETGLVDITTLTAVVTELGLSNIDFLKIDVEGYERKVLNGVPWATLKPAVIECEFEDSKTLPLGYRYSDLADDLVARGYTVYVSEWHPIVRYGLNHQWRRVMRYRDAAVPEDAWGNLLAFLEDPGLDAVSRAFEQCLTKKEWIVESRPNLAGKETKIMSSTVRASTSLGNRLALWAERNSPALLKAGRRVKRLRAGIRTWRSEPEVKAEQLNELSVELQLLKKATSQKLETLEQTIANLRSELAESTAALATLAQGLETLRRPDPRGHADFQPFNRRLDRDVANQFTSVWGPKLGLVLTAQTLRYMAHRVSITESICVGRLATSLETIILRTLVAQSVKDPTLSVLEIGTLFGVGLGIIHDITRAKFESTHLTVIDPFDGYYGQNKADIVTGQAVTEQQFRRNLRRLAVQEDELSVVRAYSQDESAIKAASARTYNVLIIDGDHSGEGVLRDFNLYRPFVSQGGFIVFDDYGTDHWPEIKPAIDEHVLPLTDLEFIGAEFRTAIFRVR